MNTHVKLTFGARHPRVADITGWTGAHGFVALHLTEGVRRARISHGARVQALSIDAGVVHGALGVVAAFRCQRLHAVRRN